MPLPRAVECPVEYCPAHRKSRIAADAGCRSDDAEHFYFEQPRDESGLHFHRRRHDCTALDLHRHRWPADNEANPQLGASGHVVNPRVEAQLVQAIRAKCTSRMGIAAHDGARSRIAAICPRPAIQSTSSPRRQSRDV